MKTSCFDAVVNFFPKKGKESFGALFVHKKSEMPGSFHFYQQTQKDKPSHMFVRVHTREPLVLRWQDRFKVLEPRGKASLGEGKVLNPHSEKIDQKRVKKRIAFLQRLQGDEKDMLIALVQDRGIHGIREKEIMHFSSLRRREVEQLSQELEEEGKLRILSFSPLFLLSRESFDFLCEKILAFLSHFHKKHPRERGAFRDKLRKRFSLNPKILCLALTRLSKENKITEFNDKVALSDFESDLFPEEERVLQKLEEMCFKGEFRSVSLEDLRQKFHLSSQKLNKMLSLLIERKKIVQGKEGFIIHSRWLEETIAKVQDLGRRELSVSDFKKMTGLSRKYAIPLLELLDQLGVTRRKGPTREIL